MVAKKKFVLIAYDIAKDKARNKIAKQLENYGARINLSVFECMLTEMQLEKLQVSIANKIDTKTDTIVYYTICVNCFTKITKLPDKPFETKTLQVI
jgi:CRISPR-associated protein Cas2